MSDDPLISSRMKIDRAKKHFNDLNAEITAFSALEPYRIVVDEDSEPAVKIYKVHIIEQVPEIWSASIGDIIHNLRSALDSLATSLVIANGQTSEVVMSETYFPIRRCKANLADGNAMAFFRRTGPKAEKLIRRLQPYRGGRGHALWQLHRLDIIDKHRTIIPVGANLAKVQIAAHGDSAHPGKPTYPLKEGDELFRSVFFEPHFDAKTDFVFQVAFGEGQVVDGQPLMPTLKEFIYLVERTIMIFAKHIFRCAW